MMNFLRAHPIASAIVGVVVFVLLYVAMSGGGSSDVAITGGASDPAQLASDTAIRQTEIQAGVANTQAGYALEAKRLDTELGLTSAQYAAALHTGDTNAALEATRLQISAQKELQTSTIAAQLEGARIQANTQQAAFDAQLKAQQINANVTMASIKASSKRGFLSKLLG